MNVEKHLKDLFELLRLRSISAQSSHKADMENACKWLDKKLSDLHFTTKIMQTKGHPVVYAELSKLQPKNYNLPTLLIYGHYDVQSPDPLDKWKSDPFKPEIRNGNIYSRGVADDKGQLYTWIAALEELKIKNQKLKINLKFLIEGEEEVGSKNLTEFISENRDLLKADIAVISDSHCLSVTQPLIEYGLRGLVYAEVGIRAFKKDVHSGLYGGNVLNPVQVLSRIITGLKNDKHKILIPHFYDNVRKLSKKERLTVNSFPFTTKEIRSETGTDTVIGETGYSVIERAGARPTLEINGIWGGYQGEGPKTIIPAEAHAKISMRLVPYQNPRVVFKLFKNHVLKLSPKGVDVKVDLLSTAEPILLNVNGDFFKKANNAYKKIFGQEPLYGLSGGTIGIVADFKNILGIDSILMGYGLPDDGLHSPNEKFSVKMFEKGIKTNIEFLKSF